jgi:hypothetical protein
VSDDNNSELRTLHLPGAVGDDALDFLVDSALQVLGVGREPDRSAARARAPADLQPLVLDKLDRHTVEDGQGDSQRLREEQWKIRRNIQ